MEKQSLTFVGDEAKVHKSSKYHPSVWGDYFIRNSLSHVENEIDDALRLIFEVDDKNYELYETSLRFRLLRQHGYNVSTDTFNKFRDDNGSFISTLKRDAKGLLSLYNVSYLATHGETILDEANYFTKSQLVSLLSELEQPLETQVSLFLEVPLCRRIKSLLARIYIPIYQKDAMRDDVILELAKLDFNLLQTLHQEELKKVSIWWNDLALAKSLKFVRDRIVEAYYWVLGMYYEPQYSRARVMCTKAFGLLSIMDDIYDNYSTLEERKLLTEAIKRWNRQAVDSLPEYTKDFYLKLLKTFEEFEAVLELNEKYRVQYLKNEFKVVAIAYFEESKWGVERYVPSLEEHLRVSLISAACSLVICSMYLGMGEVATKEVFEWYSSFPKPVEACSVIGRLLNDIRSHETEQERDHVASTVECYMKEHGTDVKVACEKLREMLEKAWKDLNKERLNPTLVARPIIERILSLSISMEDVYRDTDEYTHSDKKMKDNVSLVLVEPVPI
ncbi:hypothetical protein ZIOFF_039040 [Zingiber officinale]|uniref:Sesquiterpene synthase n=1 Tax=Zingiber officinale TaxID=94328 RepID=A0A8J5KT67_ZINOF|nr:hypothetical protein ZIOFF_039040 [Zingiber officinale]